MKRSTSSILATAAAAALSLGLAGPATAATASFPDAKGDVAHGVDLQKVTVVNEKFVRIVLQHDDLVRSPRSGASGVVYLDTDPSHAGPEYAFTGGLYEGTDYALVHTDGWKLGKPVTKGFYVMRLDYDADVTRIKIGRGALGKPGKVRVAVKVAGEQKDGTIVRDWLGARRQLTSWVARG